MQTVCVSSIFPFVDPASVLHQACWRGLKFPVLRVEFHPLPSTLAAVQVAVTRKCSSRLCNLGLAKRL